MFGFGKRKGRPPLRKSNPGIAVEAKVAFSNGGRSWSEEFNVVELAASVLKNKGHSVQREKIWLVDSVSGFLLSPQLVELQPLDNGGVQTVTTMQSNHPELVPEGVFEYQHSTGDSVADSISKGFDQWAQLDFIPLLAALHPEPKWCTALVIEFPAERGKLARTRRALLGPVMHFMQNPPDQKDPVGDSENRQADDREEHPFCPCCLLTRSFEAYKELIEGDGFYGLRLFAARDSAKEAQADCRVNGDDWEKGAQALRAYVSTWPDAGYEFRKQYVVLQTINKSL